MQNGADAYSSQSRKATMWIVVGAVVLLIAVAFGLGGYGLAKRQGAMDDQPIAGRTGSGGDPMLAQGSDPQTPMLRRQGAGTQPITPQGSDPSEPATMPAHIRDWLEHLERIEERKVELTEDQTAQAMTVASTGAFAGLDIGGLLDEALGGEDAYDENSGAAHQALLSADQWRQEWLYLIQDFGSNPPPPECAALAGEYNEHLGEVRVFMGEVGSAFESFQDTDRSPEEASRAIRGLMSLDRESQAIDEAGQSSQDELRAIFRRYNESPWFRIDPDPGGGFGGILGIGR